MTVQTINRDKDSLRDLRTAIIAGNGLLPISVARALREAGAEPFLLPLKGEADVSLYDYEHEEISSLQFGRLIRAMRKAGVKQVVLAGGVRNRPHLSDLKLDLPTLVALPLMAGALGKGDDALLRAFIRLLERFGFRLIGAHEVVPDLLSPASALTITATKPNAHDQKNIALAMEAALRLGDLDVGQGAIAAGGRVIALEGAEGTDLMIERVHALRSEGRVPKRGGVLVKMAKPRQDERADLPAIGLSTIENVAKAGLAGVAIEAGRTFILGFAETIEAANRLGVFVTTIEREKILKTKD